ncbi:MAG: acyltransferase [Bacteroidota bacterium]
MNQDNKRIFGLDLLRFAAIISVLLVHSTSALFNENPVVGIGGFLGVEFFFVLSGMLIGTIIIKTHIKEKVTTFSSIKVFWVRRWFRTLPNYYLMFIVYLILAFVSKDHPDIHGLKWVAYLLFLQNATTPEINSFFGVAWSLCIEEWFYLLFPIFLILMQVFFKKKSISLLATIFIFIIIPLVGRVILSFTNTLEWDSGFRKMLFLRLDSIAIGVLGAFINHYFINFWTKNKNRLFVLGTILLVSSFVISYYTSKYDFAKQPKVGDIGFFAKTGLFTLIDISIALFLPVLCALQINKSNYLGKMVTFISLISYSLYLLHPVVIILTIHFLRNESRIIMFSVIWMSSIIGAYLQYNLFEIKMTSLRDRFFKKKQVVTVT